MNVTIQLSLFHKHTHVCIYIYFFMICLRTPSVVETVVKKEHCEIWKLNIMYMVDESMLPSHLLYKSEQKETGEWL